MAQQRQDNGGLTVMVIEDDDDHREVVADVLDVLGYRAVVAQHGADALVQLREMRELPDALLLDMMMPVMDGQDFLVEWAGDPRLAAVPVVVLSGSPLEPSGPQPSWTLRKPFQIDDLELALHEVTGRVSEPLTRR